MKNSLSRKKAPHTSLIRNQVTSLILYERIITTRAKSKEVKGLFEHLIKNFQNGSDLQSRRLLAKYLFDDKAVKKVIDVFTTRYKTLNSGLIRTYKLNNRRGDNAELVLMELVNKDEILEQKDESKISQKTSEKIATK